MSDKGCLKKVEKVLKTGHSQNDLQHQLSTNSTTLGGIFKIVRSQLISKTLNFMKKQREHKIPHLSFRDQRIRMIWLRDSAALRTPFRVDCRASTWNGISSKGNIPKWTFWSTSKNAENVVVSALYRESTAMNGMKLIWKNKWWFLWFKDKFPVFLTTIVCVS